MTYSEMFYYDESGKLYPEELKRKYPYNSERKKGLIGGGSNFIFDMKTGDILSKESEYTFFPKGRLGSFKTSKDCKDKKIIWYSDVLKPQKK